MSASGLQQSEESATRNGIQALEMAFSGITRCVQDVEATKFALGAGYQGSDGGSFQNLITAWEEQGKIILKNVQDMVDTLNQTLQAHGLQQGSSNDQINTAYSESQSVFNALSG